MSNIASLGKVIASHEPQAKTPKMGRSTTPPVGGPPTGSSAPAESPRRPDPAVRAIWLGVAIFFAGMLLVLGYVFLGSYTVQIRPKAATALPAPGQVIAELGGYVFNGKVLLQVASEVGIDPHDPRYARERSQDVLESDVLQHWLLLEGINYLLRTATVTTTDLDEAHKKAVAIGRIAPYDVDLAAEIDFFIDAALRIEAQQFFGRAAAKTLWNEYQNQLSVRRIAPNESEFKGALFAGAFANDASDLPRFRRENLWMNATNSAAWWKSIHRARLEYYLRRYRAAGMAVAQLGWTSDPDLMAWLEKSFQQAANAGLIAPVAGLPTTAPSDVQFLLRAHVWQDPHLLSAGYMPYLHVSEPYVLHHLSYHRKWRAAGPMLTLRDFGATMYGAETFDILPDSWIKADGLVRTASVAREAARTRLEFQYAVDVRGWQSSYNSPVWTP